MFSHLFWFLFPGSVRGVLLTSLSCRKEKTTMNSLSIHSSRQGHSWPHRASLSSTIALFSKADAKVEVLKSTTKCFHIYFGFCFPARSLSILPWLVLWLNQECPRINTSSFQESKAQLLLLSGCKSRGFYHAHQIFSTISFRIILRILINSLSVCALAFYFCLSLTCWGWMPYTSYYMRARERGWFTRWASLNGSVRRAMQRGVQGWVKRWKGMLPQSYEQELWVNKRLRWK